MSKYTSGPWSVGEPRKMGDERHGYIWWDVPVHVGELCNRGNCLAIVCLGGEGATSSVLEDVKLNACLIAAAPDCYEALKALHDLFENGDFYIRKFNNRITNGDQDVIDAMFKKVDVALAKVEKA